MMLQKYKTHFHPPVKNIGDSVRTFVHHPLLQMDLQKLFREWGSDLLQVVRHTEKVSCPRCGSSEISRSRLRNMFERYLYATWQLHPFRCYECTTRFWRRRLWEDAPAIDGNCTHTVATNASRDL